MIEQIAGCVIGHITVRDFETKEVLIDKDNAVHYGNISTEIAQALTGDPNSFITYMAFGNGGVIIDSSGGIVYRSPNTSLNKNPNAQPYNTTLVFEMTNAASNVRDPLVKVPQESTLTGNYEDILAQVVLVAGFPQGQKNMDNASGSNNQIIDDSTTFVFNEIALYCGPKGLGTLTESTQIQNFIVNPSTRLITHVIFHPVQKSLNRVLEITYTLRIQMGI
jgi:hypothetical protein